MAKVYYKDVENLGLIRVDNPRRRFFNINNRIDKFYPHSIELSKLKFKKISNTEYKTITVEEVLLIEGIVPHGALIKVYKVENNEDIPYSIIFPYNSRGNFKFKYILGSEPKTIKLKLTSLWNEKSTIDNEYIYYESDPVYLNIIKIERLNPQPIYYQVFEISYRDFVFTGTYKANDKYSGVITDNNIQNDIIYRVNNKNTKHIWVVKATNLNLVLSDDNLISGVTGYDYITFVTSDFIIEKQVISEFTDKVKSFSYSYSNEFLSGTGTVVIKDVYGKLKSEYQKVGNEFRLVQSDLAHTKIVFQGKIDKIKFISDYGLETEIQLINEGIKIVEEKINFSINGQYNGDVIRELAVKAGFKNKNIYVPTGHLYVGARSFSNTAMLDVIKEILFVEGWSIEVGYELDVDVNFPEIFLKIYEDDNFPAPVLTYNQSQFKVLKYIESAENIVNKIRVKGVLPKFTVSEDSLENLTLSKQEGEGVKLCTNEEFNVEANRFGLDAPIYFLVYSDKLDWNNLKGEYKIQFKYKRFGSSSVWTLAERTLHLYPDENCGVAILELYLYHLTSDSVLYYMISLEDNYGNTFKVDWTEISLSAELSVLYQREVISRRGISYSNTKKLASVDLSWNFSRMDSPRVGNKNVLWSSYRITGNIVESAEWYVKIPLNGDTGNCELSSLIIDLDQATSYSKDAVVLKNCSIQQAPSTIVSYSDWIYFYELHSPSVPGKRVDSVIFKVYLPFPISIDSDIIVRFNIWGKEVYVAEEAEDPTKTLVEYSNEDSIKEYGLKDGGIILSPYITTKLQSEIIAKRYVEGLKEPIIQLEFTTPMLIDAHKNILFRLIDTLSGFDSEVWITEFENNLTFSEGEFRCSTVFTGVKARRIIVPDEEFTGKTKEIIVRPELSIQPLDIAEYLKNIFIQDLGVIFIGTIAARVYRGLYRIKIEGSDVEIKNVFSLISDTLNANDRVLIGKLDSTNFVILQKIETTPQELNIAEFNGFSPELIYIIKNIIPDEDNIYNLSDYTSEKPQTELMIVDSNPKEGSNDINIYGSIKVMFNMKASVMNPDNIYIRHAQSKEKLSNVELIEDELWAVEYEGLRFVGSKYNVRILNPENIIPGTQIELVFLEKSLYGIFLVYKTLAKIECLEELLNKELKLTFNVPEYDAMSDFGYKQEFWVDENNPTTLSVDGNTYDFEVLEVSDDGVILKVIDNQTGEEMIQTYDTTINNTGQIGNMKFTIDQIDNGSVLITGEAVSERDVTTTSYLAVGDFYIYYNYKIEVIEVASTYTKFNIYDATTGELLHTTSNISEGGYEVFQDLKIVVMDIESNTVKIQLSLFSDINDPKVSVISDDLLLLEFGDNIILDTESSENIDNYEISES